MLLVARGSSDNAAIYGRYLLEVAAGVPAGLAAPSVATHYGARARPLRHARGLVSQSGATAEIVETQAWARDLRRRHRGASPTSRARRWPRPPTSRS